MLRAFLVHAGLFECFCNPPNSDTDTAYRILKKKKKKKKKKKRNIIIILRSLTCECDLICLCVHAGDLGLSSVLKDSQSCLFLLQCSIAQADLSSGVIPLTLTLL